MSIASKRLSLHKATSWGMLLLRRGHEASDTYITSEMLAVWYPQCQEHRHSGLRGAIFPYLLTFALGRVYLYSVLWSCPTCGHVLLVFMFCLCSWSLGPQGLPVLLVYLYLCSWFKCVQYLFLFRISLCLVAVWCDYCSYMVKQTSFSQQKLEISVSRCCEYLCATKTLC